MTTKTKPVSVLPTSGFDDETAPPAPAATITPPEQVVQAPAPALTDSEQLAVMRAEMARLMAENAKLSDVALEALKRKGDDKPAEPEAPPVPTFKLYFIGTRSVEPKGGMPGYIEADLMASEQGPIHVCGRGGLPVVFRGDRDDDQPHAFVHQTFGDWLIAEDGRKDAYGKTVEPRYKWGDR